jgi:hypothetical protein
MNCKDVCTEIDESERGQELSLDAAEHLRMCAECRSFYQDRNKLRQMVASLETIEAPADFDFRLRARLANEKVNSRSRVLLGPFSFGLPSVAVALLILIVGAVVFYRGYKPVPVAQITPPAVTPNAPPNTLDHQTPGAGNQTAEVTQPVKPGKPKRSPASKALTTVAQKTKSAVVESAVVPAPTIRQNDSVAAFPIGTSNQSLKVSFDDGSGIPKTISLPTVSFGSQRVLTRGDMQVFKTSAKGVW